MFWSPSESVTYRAPFTPFNLLGDQDFIAAFPTVAGLNFVRPVNTEDFTKASVHNNATPKNSHSIRISYAIFKDLKKSRLL